MSLRHIVKVLGGDLYDGGAPPTFPRQAIASGIARCPSC